MKTLLITSLLFSISAFAHDLSIGPYVKMQDALASDNFKSALEAHKFICDKELIHYKDDYKDCDKKFKDIEELRTMAKAKWIQKPGTLRNPYYGKSMLDCGEKI